MKMKRVSVLKDEDEEEGKKEEVYGDSSAELQNQSELVKKIYIFINYVELKK